MSINKFEYEYPYRFESFWKNYPNGRRRLTGQSVRGNKKRAYNAWKKLKLTDDQADYLIAALDKRKKQDPAWSKDQGAFVPQAATFLNGRMWEDSWQPEPRRFVPSVEQTDTRPEWKKRGFADFDSYRAVTDKAALDAFAELRSLGVKS